MLVKGSLYFLIVDDLKAIDWRLGGIDLKHPDNFLGPAGCVTLLEITFLIDSSNFVSHTESRLLHG